MEMNKFLAAEKLANELRAIKKHLENLIELSTISQRDRQQIQIKIHGITYNEDGDKMPVSYEMHPTVWVVESILAEYTDLLEKRIDELTEQLKAL